MELYSADYSFTGSYPRREGIRAMLPLPLSLMGNEKNLGTLNTYQIKPMN